MRKEQVSDTIDRLPSTGKPFNSQNSQNLVNTQPPDVLQSIADALGAGMIYDVVAHLFVVTPTQGQRLKQVQSTPSTASQVASMIGASGLINQNVTNVLNWLLKQLGE